MVLFTVKFHAPHSTLKKQCGFALLPGPDLHLKGGLLESEPMVDVLDKLTFESSNSRTAFGLGALRPIYDTAAQQNANLYYSPLIYRLSEGFCLRPGNLAAASRLSDQVRPLLESSSTLAVTLRTEMVANVNARRNCIISLKSSQKKSLLFLINKSWTSVNLFQLNKNKTEVIVFRKSQTY